MNELLDGMDLYGWARMAGCVTDVDCLSLRQECEDSCAQGDFKRAGVGGGVHREVRDEIRQDQVLWLDPRHPSPQQGNYLAVLETLRAELNQRFFLGLFKFDGHFAIYPVGAFYKQHLDRPTGTNDRLVTVILFLNEGWQPGDGGELKIWTTPGDPDGVFVLIEPRMGTVVCFLAADFWHEVLPAKKIRRSITGWFSAADSY
jgi:SM-20-related protein